jgi:hypothetical protein
MKTKWMLLTGILVVAMFVGVSVADDQDRMQKRLQDGSCGDCMDIYVVDGYCDICGCDLFDCGDGDCEPDPPQDGSGEQYGKGEPNPNENGDEDGDGNGYQNGHDR